MGAEGLERKGEGSMRVCLKQTEWLEEVQLRESRKALEKSPD